MASPLNYQFYQFDSVDAALEAVYTWYDNHQNDKILLLSKIKRCAFDLKLDVNNFYHISVIINCFLSVETGMDCYQMSKDSMKLLKHDRKYDDPSYE